jgi:hypothetical protein
LYHGIHEQRFEPQPTASPSATIALVANVAVAGA